MGRCFEERMLEFYWDEMKFSIFCRMLEQLMSCRL